MEIGIVEHDGVTVAREPDVELDRGDAELDGAAKPCERVLLVQARHAAMPDHERPVLAARNGFAATGARSCHRSIDDW